MSKKLLKGLILHDFLLAQKAMCIFLIAFLFSVLFGILTILSSQMGNLARYKDAFPLLTNSLKALSKLIPVFILACHFECNAKHMVLDQNSHWCSFRHATPVYPFQYALARSCYLLISFLASLVLSLGYLTIIGILNGTGISKEEFAFTLLVFLFFLCIYVLTSTTTVLFKNQYVMLLILLPSSFLPTLFMMNMYSKMDITTFLSIENFLPVLVQHFNDFCVRLLPIMPLLLAAALAINTLLTYIIYKRREK